VFPWQKQQPVTVALVGAGNRGFDVYSDYIQQHPETVRLVAVAEPNPERLERVRTRHNLQRDQLYTDWQALLQQKRLADALIIATPDHAHVEPALQGLERGYHLLLEKPVATSKDDLFNLVDAAKNTQGTITVAHVLRYTPFFSTIRQLVCEGRIGKLMSVDHLENIGYWHFAHSYVRGNWRNQEVGGPMILAKACHDLDVLRWVVGRSCQALSSFGSLRYFTPENAPKGAADRCFDCPVERECAYSAIRFYVEQHRDNHGWPVSVLSSDTSLQGRIHALREGPYGQCVYHADNDVADHQVVIMEFDGGITASLTVSAFTQDNTRTLKLMGSLGEIRGHLEKGEIEVRDFLTNQQETIALESVGRHAGGDAGLMQAFVAHLHTLKSSKDKEAPQPLTSLEASLESHLLAFAAEEARLERKTVQLAPPQGEA
jgi:predicted dehydrogenase